MSHFIVKLTSGEFVYGTVDPKEKDDKMLVINNPLVWEEYEMEDGRTGSALVKYVVGTKETQVPIAITSITSIVTMSQSFEDFYEAAVAVQKITDEAYDEKLSHMTKKMVSLVIDYQARSHASDTDGIVVSLKDSDTTIH